MLPHSEAMALMKSLAHESMLSSIMVNTCVHWEIGMYIWKAFPSSLLWMYMCFWKMFAMFGCTFYWNQNDVLAVCDGSSTHSDCFAYGRMRVGMGWAHPQRLWFYRRHSLSASGRLYIKSRLFYSWIRLNTIYIQYSAPMCRYNTLVACKWEGGGGFSSACCLSRLGGKCRAFWVMRLIEGPSWHWVAHRKRLKLSSVEHAGTKSGGVLFLLNHCFRKNEVLIAAQL